MIHNYLKIAWRNILRNKTFSIINIVGLALGMASSMLILLWIQDELSIGTQYPNAPYMYRVMSREFNEGKVQAFDETPGLLADELKKQFPEVSYAAGFVWWERFVLTIGNKVDRQMGAYAGADWFKMYSTPLLAGSPITALNAPNNVAVSRKLAEKYFGKAQNALGKTIRFNNQKDYQISAVFENTPSNAEYKYDFLLTWADLLSRYPQLNDWSNSGPRTRLQLQPGTDVGRFEAKVNAFFTKRNKNPSSSLKVAFFLQPEVDAYLYSNFKNGFPNGGRIQYVRLFTIVALFLLLIAVINFTNLATARSVKRAKEVGVRKAIGAVRELLIKQFLSEALLMTALALTVASLLVIMALPAFNQLTTKQIAIPYNQLWFWAMWLGTGLLVGLLAGSYPALFLSSLNPTQVLKNSLRFGAGARTFRQSLVVFQFTLSMLFIIGSIVVYRQLAYVQTKNLGYDRESLLYITAEGELEPKYQTFKQELLRMPGIQSVSFMQQNLTEFNNSTVAVSWPGKDPSTVIEFAHQSAGYDLVNTLKLQLRGRDFSPNFSTDSTNYLINEAAARRIGYAEPIGKPLTQWGRQGTIIGVLKDFHYGSLHKPIAPLIIRLSHRAYGHIIMIRTQSGQTKTALSSLETVYKRINPAFPFAYQFADAEYEKLYRSEIVVGTLSTVFACLAVFIACLGLFGLAAFTAEQRTKEIGVRKVLGASVASVVALLSKDFLKLVMIAIILASPLAWWVMHRWLQNFAYRIEVDWWVFAYAGALAISIALLTISFQSVKAALINPVKSLRSE